MLRILLLIAFSLSFLLAKDMPITQSMEIVIPYREFSILQFPFDIKDVKFSPFEYKVTANKKKNDILDKKLSMPKLNNNPNNFNPNVNANLNELPPSMRGYGKNLSKSNKKNKSPIHVLKGKRFLQFYPKKVGNIEVTVWGYRKYPLLIKLIIVPRGKPANNYINFLDYHKEEAEEANNEFKTNQHEKICTKLIYFLYNNKIPKSFKIISPYKVYNDNTLKYILIRKIEGRRYAAYEYQITNITNNDINLIEPMFASKYTYAVAIENRHLKSGDSTRLFIVTPAVRKK